MYLNVLQAFVNQFLDKLVQPNDIEARDVFGRWLNIPCIQPQNTRTKICVCKMILSGAYFTQPIYNCLWPMLYLWKI